MGLSQSIYVTFIGAVGLGVEAVYYMSCMILWLGFSGQFRLKLLLEPKLFVNSRFELLTIGLRFISGSTLRL